LVRRVWSLHSGAEHQRVGKHVRDEARGADKKQCGKFPAAILALKNTVLTQTGPDFSQKNLFSFPLIG